MDVYQYSAICILGGDGTFHESVNGYMERTDDARLVVPLAALPGVQMRRVRKRKWVVHWVIGAREGTGKC